MQIEKEKSVNSGWIPRDYNTLRRKVMWYISGDKSLQIRGIQHAKRFLCSNHYRKIRETPWVRIGHVIRQWMPQQLPVRQVTDDPKRPHPQILTMCELPELWYSSKKTRRKYTNDRLKISWQFNWMQIQKEHIVDCRNQRYMLLAYLIFWTETQTCSQCLARCLAFSKYTINTLIIIIWN